MEAYRYEKPSKDDEQNEGKKISEDILEKISQIEKKNEEIFALSTGLIDEYVVKLEARIKEILKTEELDKSRLMQEVVIYALIA